MASTNGIPERRPDDVPETEPLLGRPGDATQLKGDSWLKNLGLGTCSSLKHSRPVPAMMTATSEG